MTAKCERGGCERPIKAHGLCQMHYDRERGRHRHREDRVLATRARNRAVAALIKAHPDEFAELLANCMNEVLEEDKKIRALAEEHGVEVADKRRVFRLKRGRAAEDQEPEDRVQLMATDGNCMACGTFHAAGHSCPTCASNQKLETSFKSPAPGPNSGTIRGQLRDKARTPTPVTARNVRAIPVSQEAQIEKALRAGKSAAWVSANLVEPMVVVMTVLERLQKQARQEVG